MSKSGSRLVGITVGALALVATAVLAAVAPGGGGEALAPGLYVADDHDLETGADDARILFVAADVRCTAGMESGVAVVVGAHDIECAAGNYVSFIDGSVGDPHYCDRDYATNLPSHCAVGVSNGVRDRARATDNELAIDAGGNIVFVESVTDSVLLLRPGAGPVCTPGDADSRLTMLASRYDMSRLTITSSLAVSDIDPNDGTDPSCTAAASTPPQTVPLPTSGVAPEHIALGNDGKVYVTDETSCSVIRVDIHTRAVDTLATPLELIAAEVAHGIPEDEVLIQLRSGAVLSPEGFLYVGSDGDDCIYAIDIDGTPGARVSVLTCGEDAAVTVGGDPDLDRFMAQTADGDLLVVDDRLPDAQRILRITPQGAASVFLGAVTLNTVAALGGTSTTANLAGDIGYDPDGNFYVLEENNDAILKWPSIDPATGEVDRTAGSVFLTEDCVGAALGETPDVDYEGGFAWVPPQALNPSVALAVVPPELVVAEGGDAQFELHMSNTGDSPVVAVTVTASACADLPALTGGDTNGNGALDLAETWTYGCSIRAVTAPLRAPGMTVQAGAADLRGAPIATATASARLSVVSLSLEPPAAHVRLGRDGPSYTASVLNTGDVTFSLTAVDICGAAQALSPDPQPIRGDGAARFEARCAPASVTADRVVTASARGTGPAGQPVTLEATADIDAIDPKIEIFASAPVAEILRGGTVQLELTVENTGDSPLTDVAVTTVGCTSDPKLAPGATTGPLAAGQTRRFECPIADILEDVSASATVNAVAVDGEAVSAMSGTVSIAVLIPVKDDEFEDCSCSAAVASVGPMSAPGLGLLAPLLLWFRRSRPRWR